MNSYEVKSEIPGTFYRSPSPGAPPLKADGASVQVGDAIGLIEVMKTFHQIHSEFAGTITFLVEDDEPVMPGQVIAEVTG